MIINIYLIVWNMEIIDWMLLSSLVIWGVFITWWLTPITLLVINRLLFHEADPFLILFICMFAAAIWDLLLRYFDEYIHIWMDHRLKIKKKDKITKHKRWVARKFSHWIRYKMQYIDNQIMLFFWVLCASFSFVPDFFIVEFSRKKMRISHFLPAMFLGKSIAYAPLIWWSVWFLEIAHLYL